MTDTGTSCAYVPTKLYNSVIDKITENVQDVMVDDYGTLYFDCTDNLPVISLLFGGYWMEMLPEDYVFYDKEVDMCTVCVVDSGDDTWLLGDAFMRGFYSTHDHKEERFGFAPHSNSSKNALEKGEEPAQELIQLTNKEITQIVGLACAGGLIIIAVILLVVFIKPPVAMAHKKTEQLKEQLAYENVIVVIDEKNEVQLINGL